MKLKKSLDDNFWRKYFTVYDELNDSIPYVNLLKQLSEHVPKNDSDKILDIGGGTGNLVRYLTNNSKLNIVVLDKSQVALQICKKKFPFVEIKQHDILNTLPYHDAEIDSIVCNNTLYAINKNQHSKVIKEFFRVLKNGGVIVMTNPMLAASMRKVFLSHVSYYKNNFGTLRTIKMLAIKMKTIIKILYYNYIIKTEAEAGRYHFFYKGEQAELLEQNGFSGIGSIAVYEGQNELVYAKK